MSNVATVSFKLSPEQYAVLRAMALSESKSVSWFVREVVSEALDLDRQIERLASLFADGRKRGAAGIQHP